MGKTLHSERGFTLVELMITVVIVGILLAVAAPGLRKSLDRTRLQSTAGDLFSSLMLARSEALKRNEDVILLCKKDDGSRCTVNGTDGVWKYGWLVYPASDPNEILTERGALVGGQTLWAVDDPNDASPSAKFDDISYQSNGASSDMASFVVCNSEADTDTGRRVSVEITGRPKQYESTKHCAF